MSINIRLWSSCQPQAQIFLVQKEATILRVVRNVTMLTKKEYKGMVWYPVLSSTRVGTIFLNCTLHSYDCIASTQLSSGLYIFRKIVILFEKVQRSATKRIPFPLPNPRRPKIHNFPLQCTSNRLAWQKVLILALSSSPKATLFLNDRTIRTVSNFLH